MVLDADPCSRPLARVLSDEEFSRLALSEGVEPLGLSLEDLLRRGAPERRGA